MAFVIDRVDLLAYAAEDARVRDAATGTLSVPLDTVAAYYLRETVPDGGGEPLTLACWKAGHDLVIEDGVGLLPQLAAGARLYASGPLQRRILESEDRTLLRNEVVCRAADVVVLRGPDGRRTAGSPLGRSRSASASRVSDVGSSASSSPAPARLARRCRCGAGPDRTARPSST